MIALLLAMAAAPVAGPELALRKDWALSRCIGRAAGPPFRDDANQSAAALLERSTADIAVFHRLDALVTRALSRKRGGSVPGRYTTLTCVELLHSAALQRAAGG